MPLREYSEEEHDKLDEGESLFPEKCETCQYVNSKRCNDCPYTGEEE